MTLGALVHRRDFTNYSERRTRRVLVDALAGSGCWVNVQTRLEDVISPDAEDDAQDVRFLRDAHFDFTVHRESSHQALWAFEFDGPQHATDRAQVRRDVRKNRICLTAELPLLRVDDTHLVAHEKQALLTWHVRRWLAYERTMPAMLEERDKAINEIPPEDLAEHGMWLFGERPELDVDFVFNLENPYLPLTDISERLMEKHGIYVTGSFSLSSPEMASFQEPKYLARMRFLGSLLDPATPGFHRRWRCPVSVEPYTGDMAAHSDPVFEVDGVWDVRFGYPICEEQDDAYDTLSGWIEAGGFPFLPAGPMGAGALEVGDELAQYRALLEVESWASSRR